MVLTVLERLLILGLLPGEGGIIEMRLKKVIGEKIGLTSDEIVRYEVKEDGANVRWNNGVEQTSSIELNEAEVGMIRDSLVKLDREKKLNDGHITLYDKFV